MDSRALTTLRRVEQNDDTLSSLLIGSSQSLRIGSSLSEGVFHSSDSDDYLRLGAAIGNNTHLETLTVDLHGSSLSVEDRGFYDGLKRNSSIVNLSLRLDNNTIIGGALTEVLEVYQENGSHLTKISIRFCNLVNGGVDNCHNIEQMHQSKTY